MLSRHELQVALFKRTNVLVSNDRALFEQQSEPETPEDRSLIQSIVDDYIKRVNHIVADLESPGYALRRCHTDIERPTNEE